MEMTYPEGCAEACPACSHRHMTMAESLSVKEEWLMRKLSPWADSFEPIRSIPEPQRWRYRGKVCLNTRYHEGKWEFGMMKGDDLIQIPGCPVHSTLVRKTISLLESDLPPAEYFPMAYFFQVNDLVTLIVKGRSAPDLNWISDSLVIKLKRAGIKGLSIHLNPSAGRRLFEKTPWIVVFGEIFSSDGHGMVYGRTSFQQLLPELHREAVDIACRYLKPDSRHNVLDLYCGTGISLNRWLPGAAEVLGIETGAEAISCAQINAPDATLLRGRCAVRLPQVRKWVDRCRQQGAGLLVYLNPPRTGIEPEVLAYLVGEARPERLAYLSCSAGTMRRDLEILASGGYHIDHLIPFDFFPQTRHVECLGLLSR